MMLARAATTGRPAIAERGPASRAPGGPVALETSKKAPPMGGLLLEVMSGAQMELTSSGMPGPNVVDTAPFWM